MPCSSIPSPAQTTDTFSLATTAGQVIRVEVTPIDGHVDGGAASAEATVAPRIYRIYMPLAASPSVGAVASAP